MASRNRTLDSAVAALQRRYGTQAIRRGIERASKPPLAVSTGFPHLDALTGCNGVPLGALTLLSGRATSGKLTLAYKLLAHAQARFGQAAGVVALVDMHQTADPDYLVRCGVDLARLLLVRPATNARAVHLIVDLARSRQATLVVVDSLAELLNERATRQTLTGHLRRLPPLVRAANCGLVLIDEQRPLWLRRLADGARRDLYRQMALHLELTRDQWLTRGEQVTGYRAQAEVVHSRWSPSGGKTAIAIVFNGTVYAATTW
jgi:RecA/RadA recombinase